MKRKSRGRAIAFLVLLSLPLVVSPPAQARSPVGGQEVVAGPETVAVPAAVPRRRAPVRSGFRWPLDGVPRVVRRFDPPPEPWQRGHRGVDLAAPSGATVRAAGPGVVLFAGMVAGRPVVSVSHGDGLRTTYEPVRPAVVADEVVSAGTPLGVLLPGHSGCAYGGSACLHWGLRRGSEYLDPLLLLGLGRVRLLPVASEPPGGSGFPNDLGLPGGSGPAGPVRLAGDSDLPVACGPVVATGLPVAFGLSDGSGSPTPPGCQLLPTWQLVPPCQSAAAYW